MKQDQVYEEEKNKKTEAELNMLKYNEYIGNARDWNRVVTYIKNNNSKAAEIAEREKLKGNEIIDLAVLVEERKKYIRKKFVIY